MGRLHVLQFATICEPSRGGRSRHSARFVWTSGILPSQAPETSDVPATLSHGRYPALPVGRSTWLGREGSNLRMAGSKATGVRCKSTPILNLAQILALVPGGQNLGCGGSGIDCATLSIRNVGRDQLHSRRRVLDIARDILRDSALLLHGRCDRRRNLLQLLDCDADLADGTDRLLGGGLDARELLADLAGGPRRSRL